MLMIQVTDLTKAYGDTLAVDHISFQISGNGVVGFLGPNGAGKSTTMNMITGYISMTGGSVRIGGVDLLEDPMVAKRQIGYLPELPPLYKDLTVWEYLSFVYGLKRCKLEKKQHIRRICEEVGIYEIRNRMIGNLSKGYQQRVGIAQALIGDPPILILDEPTVGLDPAQIIQIRNLVKELGKTRIVILSTHILSEVQLLCDRIILISRGTVVADDTMENMEAEAARGALLMEIQGLKERVLEVLSQVEGVTAATWENGQYRVETDAREDLRVKLFYVLAGEGLPILGLRRAEKTLEELFVELTDDTYGQR